MNKIQLSVTTLLALFLVSGCDSNKNTSVDSGQSAQKAAAEFSKTFQETTPKDSQKMGSSKESSKVNGSSKEMKVPKKTEPSSAGITGLPKDAVEGAKSMVDETKEMAKKAAEKIEKTGSDLVNSDKSSSKPTEENASKADTAKQDNMQNGTNGKKEVDQPGAKSEMSPSSTQNAAASEAPKMTNNQPGKGNTDNQAPANKPQQSSTESAGVAGLPKDAVEGAKAMVNETKEMASNATEKMANTGKALVSPNDSSASKDTKQNADTAKAKNANCDTKKEVGSKPGAEAGSTMNSSSTQTGSAQTADSAQQAAKSEAPPKMANDQPTANNQPNPNNNAQQQQKASTESAGVAGLPKDAIEGAKTIVDKTKDLATKATNKIIE